MYFYLLMSDYVPPIFVTCQGNITETTVNSSSLTITWIDPIATDNTINSPPVSCYPSSGSSFYIGRTEVTCSVFDGFNNVSDCVFVVTVQGIVVVSYKIVVTRSKRKSNQQSFSAICMDFVKLLLHNFWQN